MAKDRFIQYLHHAPSLFSLANTSRRLDIANEGTSLTICNPPDRTSICTYCKNAAFLIVGVSCGKGSDHPKKYREGSWFCSICPRVFDPLETVPVSASIHAKVKMLHPFSDPVVFELSIEKIEFQEIDALDHTVTIRRDGYLQMVENGLQITPGEIYEFIMVPGDFRSIASIFVLEDEDLASEPGEDGITDHSHTTIG